MDSFSPGQRWINDAQLEKGLGTVLSCDARSVTIIFLATGETNIYSRQSAPLSRVRFAVGDTIISHDDSAIKVSDVSEANGLITYHGTDENGNQTSLNEALLNNFIQLNRPTERLFNGQIDEEKWFELRYHTLRHQNALAHSDLRGLTGGRTSLIPHQLYIAHEVANRYAPRVLLADEVGLGKTIEAGMILHQQLVTERAQRILIVVPESLVHQWLVEMLRRFNLMFHVFDEQRCYDITESGEGDNPFQTEQLVLCSQEFLVENPKHFKQSLQGEWDLLVVDEAHHLHWSEQDPSVEYLMIEQLAKKTKGVLLLTATPEQLGKESHFARLRLLDPDRFPSYQQFLHEEEGYEPIAHAVESILDDEQPDARAIDTLKHYIKEGDNQQLLDILQDASASQEKKQAARNDLVEHLLDRHGTGRVLFRNTRSAVKGFPQRQVHAYALPQPERYANQEVSYLNQQLHPELGHEIMWTQDDPRVAWLKTFLRKQGSAKTLVITANAQTALDIADTLKIQEAIHAAVFHEGMSLIERDRAAAWFADKEEGAPVLVCSEIGSEGRNFQFAHHLVLFDLPLNPDLLEQRIGRLDRIGQTQTIQLHVPFLEDTAQERLFDWYHVGLQAFEQTCPAGHAIYKQVEEQLLACLQSADEDEGELIRTTQKLLHEQNEALQKGRDRLLEYNSCRPEVAQALHWSAEEFDDESEIEFYMDSVYDCYGINSEEHRENSLIIQPGSHMLTTFPGLTEEGMTITYKRLTALANEDLQFFTWDHPLVQEAMDLVTTSEMGNTSLTAIERPDFKAGSLLAEALFVLDTASHQGLHSDRYLPPTTLRMVVDAAGQDLSEKLDFYAIKANRTRVDKKTAVQIVNMKQDDLRMLIELSEELASRQAPAIIAQAHEQSRHLLESEINRLQALKQVNPNIRKEEIEFYQQQLAAIDKALDSASLRLDAVRIIVTT